MKSKFIEGEWHIIKGRIKKEWGRLTDDEVTRIAGDREELAGLLQEVYGFSFEEALNAIDEFEKKHPSSHQNGSLDK